MSTTKTTAAAKKPVAKPVAKAATKEEVKVTEVKATETPVVKEEKAPAKKAPAKKAAAKTTKTAAKAEKTTKTVAKATKKAAKISVQFADKTYTTEDFEKIAKDVWVYDYAKKATELKEVELYVKPEECKVYYVFNGDVTGSFDI